MTADTEPVDVELVDEQGSLLPSVTTDPYAPARPQYPLGPGGAPPPAYVPRYEPPPPSRMEQLRRSYEDAVDLARSIDNLDLADRSRILERIAATFPEVVAAAIEDIARGHRYDYALELLP